MRSKLAGIVLCTLAALSLASCVTTGPATAKGECQIFQEPTVAISGQTPDDQGWIDDTIESGVASCHWKRPAHKSKVKAK